MSRLLLLVVAGLLIALVQMWVKYIRVPIGRVELRSTLLCRLHSRRCCAGGLSSTLLRRSRLCGRHSRLGLKI